MYHDLHKKILSSTTIFNVDNNEEMGNTLFEGVCILYNHDMTYVLNMK